MRAFASLQPPRGVEPTTPLMLVVPDVYEGRTVSVAGDMTAWVLVDMPFDTGDERGNDRGDESLEGLAATAIAGDLLRRPASPQPPLHDPSETPIAGQLARLRQRRCWAARWARAAR